MKLSSLKPQSLSVISFLLIIAFTNIGCAEDPNGPAATAKKYFALLESNAPDMDAPISSVKTEDINAFYEVAIRGEYVSKTTPTYFLVARDKNKFIKEGGGLDKVTKTRIDKNDKNSAIVNIVTKNGYPYSLELWKPSEGKNHGKWLVVMKND